jgi:hypothetical protein
VPGTPSKTQLLRHPRPKRPANFCSACGQDFTSVSLFDRHRVGVHAYTYSEGLALDPPVEDGRRCLDAEEMQAKGWELDARSRWVDPAKVEQARKAFSALNSSPERPREDSRKAEVA